MRRALRDGLWLCNRGTVLLRSERPTLPGAWCEERYVIRSNLPGMHDWENELQGECHQAEHGAEAMVHRTPLPAARRNF